MCKSLKPQAHVISYT